jgi:hypothetical protein
MRWAATELRKQEIMVLADSSERGKWELTEKPISEEG